MFNLIAPFTSIWIRIHWSLISSQLQKLGWLKSSAIVEEAQIPGSEEIVME